jgi:hypothetical protein
MVWVYLHHFCLLVLLLATCVIWVLAKEWRLLLLGCLKAPKAKLGSLGHCALKHLHFFFQEFHLNHVHVSIGSKRVHLVHDYFDHHLAKINYVWPLLRVGCHACFNCLNQQFAVVSFVNWFIFTMHNFVCNCQRVACGERLWESHQLVKNAT